MKKHIIDLETNENKIIDFTAEQIAQAEIDKENAIADKQAEETARQVYEDLKASAKAKLVAGEPLTEEEASTIVL